MTTVTMRAARRGDVEPLARMCRRTLPFDALGTDDLTWLLFDAPRSGPRYQLAAERHGCVVGMAFGSSWRNEQGALAGNLTFIIVDADAQRSGVGAMLASTLEQRWADDGAGEVLVCGSQPPYVWPGVDLRYDPGLRFFTGRGYHRIGDAHNMTVRLDDADLDADSQALLADSGYVVRRLRLSDRCGFGSWMARWGAGWQEEALSTLRHRPVSCHVALADGAFVGFAAYDTNRGGWFGPMGTVHEARGQGIGQTLLRRCLRDHREQGRAESEISWAGPTRFYERTVGARLGRTFRRLAKDLN